MFHGLLTYKLLNSLDAFVRQQLDIKYASPRRSVLVAELIPQMPNLSKLVTSNEALDF